MTTSSASNDIDFFLDIPNFVHPDEKAKSLAERTKTIALRKSIRPLAFACEEAVNQPYELQAVMEVTTDLRANHDLFLGHVMVFRAARKGYGLGGKDGYADAMARNFSGRIVETEYLGKSFAAGAESPTLCFRLVARPTMTVLRQYRHSRAFEGLTVKEIIEHVLKDYDSNTARFSEEDAGGGLPGGAQDSDTGSTTANIQFEFGSFNSVPYAERDWALQYDETDLDFILRWMERQGWNFTFKFPDLEGKEPEDGMMAYGEDWLSINSFMPLSKIGCGKSQLVHSVWHEKDKGVGITRLVSRATPYPRQIEMSDFNPNKQGEILAVATTDRKKGLPKVVLHGEYFASVDEGKFLANLRDQAYKCHITQYQGEANLPGIKPGGSYLLFDDAIEELTADGVLRAEGEYHSENDLTAEQLARINDGMWQKCAHLVLRATHRAVASYTGEPPAAIFSIPGMTAGVGYSVKYVAVPYDVDYRPLRTIPWPKIAGPVTGWILPSAKGETLAAASSSGKYRVRLKGVRRNPDASWTDGTTLYIPVTSETRTGAVETSVALPANLEVLVSFRDGNPDRPVIIGVTPTDSIRNVTYADTFIADIFKDIEVKMIAGDGGTGTLELKRKDSKEAFSTLNVSGSLTTSKKKATLARSEALVFEKHSFANAKTSAQISNKLTSSSSAETWEKVVEMIEEVFNKYSEVEDLVKTINPDVEDDLSQGGKAAWRITDDAFTTAINLEQLVVWLKEFSPSKFPKERVSLVATESESTLSTAAMAPTLPERILLATDIALKMCTDAINFSKAVTSRVHTIQADQKTTHPDEEGKKKYDAGDIENLPGMWSESLGVNILGSVVDLSKAITQILSYIKLLRTALMVDLGNSGVRIESRISSEADRAKLLATGVAAGLTTKVLADGDVCVGSDRMVRAVAGVNSTSTHGKGTSALKDKFDEIAQVTMTGVPESPLITPAVPVKSTIAVSAADIDVDAKNHIVLAAHVEAVPTEEQKSWIKIEPKFATVKSLEKTELISSNDDDNKATVVIEPQSIVTTAKSATRLTTKLDDNESQIEILPESITGKGKEKVTMQGGEDAKVFVSDNNVQVVLSNDTSIELSSNGIKMKVNETSLELKAGQIDMEVGGKKFSIKPSGTTFS